MQQGLEVARPVGVGGHELLADHVGVLGPLDVIFLGVGGIDHLERQGLIVVREDFGGSRTVMVPGLEGIAAE